ncbi:MAG: hypothetical protein SAL07_25200 [Oscillatoria sp. PMC 1051.18]|nr:hypothetical protein [Oscillatoria sp. PMC 1050.18]MEC5033204.1 hypothetical protein [Oscillatoria sp. PMC 1051.18]
MDNKLLNPGRKPFPAWKWLSQSAILATIGSLLAVSSASAQVAQSPPIFENRTIAPTFSPDPLEIRGVSGGDVTARSIVGTAESPTGACVGYIDRQPDHVLTLTSFFKFLKVEVRSSQDTTIVVKGPGGIWCNDDGSNNNKNPAIAGQWQQGAYQIWVGSYQKNAFHDYVMRITQIQ